jgi:3'(2'), 5'-bisphosphate nucleotidase/myo-inositol-1(or 4)-monophosphatase
MSRSIQLVLPKLLKLAENAVVQAGKYVQEFDHSTLSVNIKSSGTSHASQVVTQVDRDVESIILNILEPSLEEYNLAFLAEETASLENVNDHPRFLKDAFWCVDPLDGTLPFIEGNEGYAVSIALVLQDGKPLLGAVFDPIKNKLWSNSVLSLTDAHPNQDCLTFFCDRSMLTSVQWPAVETLLDEIKRAFSFTDVVIHHQYGAVKNALGVLSTPNSFYMKLPKPEIGGGSLWDFAATTALFQKAEKPCGDICGAPIHFNQRDSLFLNRNGVLYASDTQLFGTVIKVCQSLS